MGYLVCDKCHGFYKLKGGESPQDFLDTCECGGKLNYLLSTYLEKKENDSAKKNNPSNGLGNKGNISADLVKNVNPYLNKISNLDPRITRLILGVSIVLIPNLLYYNFSSNIFFAFSVIPVLLGGFVSSILVDGRVKDGVLNGTRVGLFSGLIALLIFLIFKDNFTGFTGNSTPNLGVFVVYMLVLILLASLGGFMGIITRRLLTKKVKTDETILKTQDIIDTQDAEQTKYHDEMVKLGYKQITAINDGEKVFKSLLSHSISEADAIKRLEDDKKILDEVLTEMQEITPPDKHKEYHNLKISATQDISKTFELIDGLVHHDPNKIDQTNNLVESSTTKINQAISEIHKTMQEQNNINNFK